MNTLIKQVQNNLHDIVDDLELIADDETVEEFRNRVNTLTEDLDQAFEEERP